MNTTIAFPSRNNITLANDAISCFLESCSYDILVVDDNSDVLDGEYIKDSRVTIINNKFKSGYASLVNQCIKNTTTERIIIGCSKIRPRRQDIKLIENKLDEGFACVCTNLLHIFGFSKYLTTIIGMMDTGYKHYNYEDTDWMNKLYINNLALYFSQETPIHRIASSWSGETKNQQYYGSKWIRESRRIVQLHDDENTSDRLIYKDVYREIDYLSWDHSILSPHIKMWYSGLIRNKRC